MTDCWKITLKWGSECFRFKHLVTNQGRRKLLKRGDITSKKEHMTTPLNGQNSKRFESIPNQVHIVFGWDLKIISVNVYLKNCYFL